MSSYCIDDDDEFLNLFNGMDGVCGKNERWLIHRQDQLNTKRHTTGPLSVRESSELVNVNLQMGCTATGQAKGKTCWSYVYNGRCEHANNTDAVKTNGMNVAGRWHPGEEERVYLRMKHNRVY